ncbi:MAG: amidohydrolase family protein [Bacillota bacterium]|nr:amidohydrolase family protein [Bacillota bacterium]
MGLLLRSRYLLDGLNDSAIEHGVLLIENDRIAYVGGGDGISGTGHVTVELPEHTLCPGLIDAHVHLTSDGTPEREVVQPTGEARYQAQLLRAVRNMQASLLGGVTTVRDLGAPNDLIFTLRQAERSGALLGPRIVASGANITTTGGHGWSGGHECDTADEVRKACRVQLKLGVDLIKIMSSGGVFTALSRSSNCQFSVDELREAVVEAEKMGKRVATHAHSKDAIKSSIMAGIHSIDHGIFLDDECIGLMLERGTYLVPTLAPHTYIWGNPEIRRIPQVFLEKAALIREPNFQGARRAIERGVKIAAGTDSGIPFMTHGRVVSEVETLAYLGMKPLEAIRTATRYASELLQVDDRVGTLEAGKVADVIAVHGNPLDRLEHLRNPVLVIHDGRVVGVHRSVDAPHEPGALSLGDRGGWPGWRWQAA